MSHVPQAMTHHRLSYPNGGGCCPGCLAGWGQLHGSAVTALQSVKQIVVSIKTELVVITMMHGSTKGDAQKNMSAAIEKCMTKI